MGSTANPPKKTTKIIHLIADSLTQRGWSVSTAESCTGGGIGAALTAIAGSSRWYQGGVISYSNTSKHSLLDVTPRLVGEHGAVSKPVVVAMCQGVQHRLGSEVSIAVTGIAGPDGGTDDKPVGTVWIGWRILGQQSTQHFQFEGDRQQVCAQSIFESLIGLQQRLQHYTDDD